MKLKQNQSSTQPQISDQPWVDCPDAWSKQNPEMYVLYLESGLWAKKPNPPTPEAVAKAQFVDKTYVWHGK